MPESQYLILPLNLYVFVSHHIHSLCNCLTAYFTLGNRVPSWDGIDSVTFNVCVFQKSLTLFNVCRAHTRLK